MPSPLPSVTSPLAADDAALLSLLDALVDRRIVDVSQLTGLSADRRANVSSWPPALFYQLLTSACYFAQNHPELREYYSQKSRRHWSKLQQVAQFLQQWVK